MTASIQENRDQSLGVSPAGSGYSAEPEPKEVSAADAVSIPNAWQPIDTAPRGKPVLLWKPATREHYVAALIDGGHGPGWCTPDGFEVFRATHWMLLPEPPQ